MAEKRKVPAIRFKGFTDAWEQRKLGDLVHRVVRKNTNGESGLPLTISSQYGLVDQITYFNNRVASRDVSNYYLVLNGEFAYNKSTSDGFPFGTVKRLDLHENGVLSTLYIVFNIKNAEETNSDFLTVFFDTDRWHKGVAERAAEGARNHGLLNISAEEFFDIDLYLPKSEKEQATIGTYVRSLDRRITLHQRKLSQLKNVKKALLEKMFPKNGSNVPEMRFFSFTDAWKQRKFGEVFETVTDYVAAGSFADLRKNVTYRSSPDYAQLVRTTDLKNGFNSSQSVYVDKKAFDFLYRVNLDSECIILPNIGNCGEVYHVKPEKLPHPENVLGPNAILVKSITSNNGFLSTLLQSDDFQEKLSLIVSPNGQTKFNKTELKEIHLLIPQQTDEQLKIGSLFKNFDHLITLHQRKHEKLLNIKKALLEKMFV